MISRFLSVEPSPNPGFVRIAFLDAEERSWFVECPACPNVQHLSNVLNIVSCIADEPERAIALGLISWATLREATEARDRMRAQRLLSATNGGRVH